MEPKGPVIRVTVKQIMGAVATLALAVALVASPVTVLYCDNSGPAAMACCKNKASECNQPGKTDDCCSKAPTDKDAFTGPTHQLAGKPH
jgi:hypothetical protein